MTTNLLSVIEQLVDALDHCMGAITERGLNGSPDQAEKWGLQLPLERAYAAIAAGQQALEQTQVEALERKLPGGKRTDDFESSRIGDYNQGWNDYRKAVKKMFKNINMNSSENSNPDAYLYSLEYGEKVVDTKVSIHQLNYPFGVAGADYLVRNDDGVSYVRQTKLYAALSRAQAAPAVGVPDVWKQAVMRAYGHLWHVNNEPMAPVPLYSIDSAGYEARKQLRDLLTTTERGQAINEVQAMIASAQPQQKEG